MKKVSELTGKLLDFWVAKAKGDYKQVTPNQLANYEFPAYSTDWAVGGPLLEEKSITVSQWSGLFGRGDPDGAWLAKNLYTNKAVGKTYLEAAMRCIVRSEFGDEVPDE